MMYQQDDAKQLVQLRLQLGMCAVNSVLCVNSTEESGKMQEMKAQRPTKGARIMLFVKGMNISKDWLMVASYYA